MQVDPRTQVENASLLSFTAAPVQSLTVDAFKPILQETRADQRDPRDKNNDDGAENPLAIGLAAPSSTETINEEERQLETGSRAFRRETARETGRQKFQEAREQLRDARRENAEQAEKNNGKTPQSSGEQAGKKTTAGRKTASSTRESGKTASHQEQPAQSRTSATTATEGINVTETAARSVSSGSPIAGPTSVPAGQTMIRSANTQMTRNVAAGQLAGRVVAASSAGRAEAAPGGRNAPAAVERGSSTSTKARTGVLKSGFKQHAEAAERTENLKRIVRVVSQQMRENSSRTVMRIDPPELGSLRLQMNLRGDALTLRIDTTTHVAQRLLQEDVEKLRHGLEAAGIRLERVEVRPPTPTLETPEQPNPSQSETGGDGKESFADANAEHSRKSGMESLLTQPLPESATDDPVTQPVAESLVNVIA